MTNPQDNPGTPPQPTPSDSSTPPPPSASPKPRLRRVKMLARKTAQDSDTISDSESYKSTSDGGGLGSSNSEKYQESPSKVSSSLSENLESRFVLVGPVKNVELPELRRSEGRREWPKVRGSGSGEAAKGLVHLTTQRDEPGSSTEKTLADLLKKVGSSYDPRKRRTPTPKAPSVPKPSTKRKHSSPTTTEIAFPKGRATRSRVKQSESDLQKALAESKKKRVAKGKGNVAESSEDMEVEEMEQVHHEEVQIVEVKTPKPKKPKTSSKKSSSVSKAAEHSLTKRKRPVVKIKQVKISKDEEWSG
uniref:Protein ENL-like n=1 Tax=Nicotiana sylvestris TaxID=4096 RepID=A0A1U7WBH3_NICSY|nr:PREDICTED: protein ENL-like [Nicotiana sylvestris]